MKKTSKLWVRVLIYILLFSIGLGAGWLLNTNSTGKYRSIRETTSDYQFIAPLLFVETPEEQSFPEYSNLKQALASFVETSKKREDIEEVSVYFRNLNTSQWVAVNPLERYTPASMLKVTLLLAVLRATEDDPTLLSKTVTATGVETITEKQQNYAPAHPMVSGKLYRVDELLSKLIVESDNGANQSLYRVVGGDGQVMKIYDDLGMHRPQENDSGYTAAEYSRLFRTLYNGTYLPRSQSEYALKLLSQADFTQGIVSGVSEDTVVAHKFGVRTVANENGGTSRELHDCGIVYYPEHPYFICIMTRGSDFPALEQMLAEASRITWQEVSELHK